MKIIAFILPFYILALSFTPCTDVEIKNSSETEITQSHGFEHDYTDLCSPFCSCQCCQVFTTNALSLDIDFTTNEISNQIFLRFDNLGKEINFPFLQPPRV